MKELKITVKSIKALKPCAERFNNFVSHYPKFAGALSAFVALENITYDDKVWVAVRMLGRNQRVAWSIACAESTLHIYESKYPGNKAPRAVLEYLKALPNPSAMTDSERATLWALQRAAYAADTAHDDYDAANAAANAAHSADDTAYADSATNDANAAYAAAARAAAYAAASTAASAAANANDAANDAANAAAYAADTANAANAADTAHAAAYAAAYAADTAYAANANAAYAAAYSAHATANAAAYAAAYAREEQRNLNLLLLLAAAGA